MKILHSSDWHLGKWDGDTSLYDDQKFFIDRICDIISERGIEAVLISGDVFDRALSSSDAIKLYSYAMTRMCRDLKTSVFIIAGNHDGSERLSSLNELLCNSGLYICGELDADVSPVCINDCRFFLLPWITEEKVKSVFPDEKDAVTDLTAAYRLVTDRMKAHFSNDKRNIILSHAFLAAAETSTSDRAAEIGFAARIPASVFDGFDYVALGHLHAPQSITDNSRYCGTPMPYSFGKEEAQTKGVVIIDSETMSQEFVPIEVLHKRTTIECTLSEALNPVCDEKTLSGYVRLRISDSFIGHEALAAIRQIYAHPIDIEGKSYDNSTGSVSLSHERLEELEKDPAELFRYYCSEDLGEEPDEHLVELFLAAVQEAEKEDIQ